MQETTAQEQIVLLMETYANLQRLATASDIQRELAVQIQIAKAKLDAIGVAVDGLNLSQK